MFSLCIPTYERYDDFLSKNLLNYLNYDLIDEIIITDENGNDIEKIKRDLSNHINYNKFVLIKNDFRMGPFLNKYKCCTFAKNEWIALIDSDNFANYNYFTMVKEYIDLNINKNQKNVILAPSKATPKFDFSILNGLIYKKGNFKENEKYIDKNNRIDHMAMNTGNYVLNKYLINNIDLSKEEENIKSSHSCDVIYFNTLLFEQLDLNLHIVPNLEYEHIDHPGSIYRQMHHFYDFFLDIVTNRYSNLAN